VTRGLGLGHMTTGLGMGANRFLKLGGLELVSRRARIFFFKPPQFISKPPPILGGLDINWGGGLKISKPP